MPLPSKVLLNDAVEIFFKNVDLPTTVWIKDSRGGDPIQLDMVRLLELLSNRPFYEEVRELVELQIATLRVKANELRNALDAIER